MTLKPFWPELVEAIEEHTGNQCWELRALARHIEATPLAQIKELEIRLGMPDKHLRKRSASTGWPTPIELRRLVRCGVGVTNYIHGGMTAENAGAAAGLWQPRLSNTVLDVTGIALSHIPKDTNVARLMVQSWVKRPKLPPRGRPKRRATAKGAS